MHDRRNANHVNSMAVKSSYHHQAATGQFRESADDLLSSSRQTGGHCNSNEFNRFLPQELQDELFSRPEKHHRSHGLSVDSVGPIAFVGRTPTKPSYSADSVWSYASRQTELVQSRSLYESSDSNWPGNDVRHTSLLSGNHEVAAKLSLPTSSFQPSKLVMSQYELNGDSLISGSTPTKLFESQSAYGSLVSPTNEPSLLLSGGSSASITYNHSNSYPGHDFGFNAPRLKPLSGARSSIASLNSDRGLYQDLLQFEDLDIQDGTHVNAQPPSQITAFGCSNEFMALDLAKKRRANSVATNRSDPALKPDFGGTAASDISAPSVAGKKKQSTQPKRRRCKTSSVPADPAVLNPDGLVTSTTPARRQHRRNKSEGTTPISLTPIDDGSDGETIPSATREQQEEKKVTLFKTELCRSYEETGACKFGDKCLFAHGQNEMRQISKHPKYKTEVCKSFWMEGHCKYGKRCCFLHVQNTGEGRDAGRGPSQGRVDNGQARHHRNHSNSSVDVDSNNNHKKPLSAKKSLIESFGLALDDSDTEQQQ